MKKKPTTKPARTARRKRVPMPKPFRRWKGGRVLAYCCKGKFCRSVYTEAMPDVLSSPPQLRRYSRWLLRAAAWIKDAR